MTVENAFHKRMLAIYEAAKEFDYNATRFKQMVDRHGGVQAAKVLLASPTVSSGFTTLWEKGRLDLSVEALVLEDDFADLFTFEERETARRRLDAYRSR